MNETQNDPAMDDALATQPDFIVRLAAGTQVGSGILAALVGLQPIVSGVIFYEALLGIIPYALLGFGLIQAFVGAKVFRTRVWAATLGAGVSTVVALVVGAWFLISLLGGVLSLMAICVLPLSAAAMVTGFIAIGPCKRADAARQRLHAAGIDSGM